MRSSSSPFHIGAGLIKPRPLVYGKRQFSSVTRRFIQGLYSEDEIPVVSLAISHSENREGKSIGQKFDSSFRRGKSFFRTVSNFYICFVGAGTDIIMGFLTISERKHYPPLRLVEVVFKLWDAPQVMPLLGSGER